MDISFVAPLFFGLMGTFFGIFLMAIYVESEAKEAREQKSEADRWSAINTDIRRLEIAVEKLNRAKGKRGKQK